MTLRKALLVGINAYPGAPLRGCINDILQMKELLTQHFNFPMEDIKLLTDQDATCSGIQTGLAWLAEGGQDPDAVRVFHYSGHGSYVADQNGDEPDGRDECLVPFDYQTAGMLTDDTLKLLYQHFPRQGNLTLIMDSCHSGSVNKDVANDIVYRFLPVSREEQIRINEARAKYNGERASFIRDMLKDVPRAELTDEELEEKILHLSDLFNKKRFGDIRTREGNILMAGCQSDQTSADAHIHGDYHGAFTYYMVEALQAANYQITYHELAETAGQKLYDEGYTQTPQLECRRLRDKHPVFSAFRA
jgi:hypothetical protein